jgi:hypothetical protein
MQGQAGTFSFTDPWTGVEYSQCSLEGDSMDITVLSDESARISLVIREDLT